MPDNDQAYKSQPSPVKIMLSKIITKQSPTPPVVSERSKYKVNKTRRKKDRYDAATIFHLHNWSLKIFISFQIPITGKDIIYYSPKYFFLSRL